MKLYPGNHVIVADCEQTTQSTLQLSYYKEVERDITPVIKIEDEFCQDKDTRIYPYQQFKIDNLLFLDENKKLHYISAEAPMANILNITGYIDNTYTLNK